MVSTSRAFQNTTTFDLRLISHGGRAARSLPLEKMAPHGPITWIAVNSYPGKVVVVVVVFGFRIGHHMKGGWWLCSSP